MVGVERMLTEAKRSERYKASLTADGRYRLLVEAVRDYAIYMLDPDGIITSWNQGAHRFKGYEAHEIIGHHFSRFYTEEDKQSGLPRRALDTALRTGLFEQEGWRVRKDGTRFWAHVVIDPIFSDAGELIGFAKVTRDLTERMRAAETLRQSEEQFRLLVQSVTDYAIYMLDPNGFVTNWNAGAERLKGYRPDEIIGQHFSRFYTEEEKERGQPDLNLQIAAREGRFEKEGWRVRKDGSQFWANVVIDPIRGADGTLIGFAKITRDFTERRKTQQELEKAREALFQFQKMESIGQLTGGIAHDFNNLLMAILGSLELVRKRMANDPRITPLLDNAFLAGRRGAILTQRMLMFARRQELNPESTDLLGLIRGMSDMLERSIGPMIRIETRFPISLPRVLVDPNQLESALLNLCLNARDAMPEGGAIIIAAEATTSTTSGEPVPGVCLSVTDTGTGMDEETRARATEPFFTTKGVGKGTGLGLSMVRGLIEQSGGSLAITSKLGQGTAIELWLPIAEDGADKNLPVSQHQVVVQKTPPIVVLAVDDDHLVLMNARAMLEDLGHTPFTATSGAEAIEIMSRIVHVDLVITDQAMPNMSGYQLAQFMKEQWPEVPVIIATGYAELPPSVGNEMVKLSKPYFQGDLERAIADAMVRARAR
jgi:PAS domain S-box-containing protein